MASAFEEHCNQENGLPSWNKTVNGGAKRAAAEFIPRLDLSSVGSCFNSINLFPDQSGFGSPIAVIPRSEHRTSSDDHQDGCSGFVTSFRPAASTIPIPSKQSCAQLTIFYGGVVNVYDDIPPDQAQAIMLIASSENYSGYPHTKVQNSTCRSQTELKTSLPVMKFSGESGIHHQPASCKVHIDLIRSSNREEAFSATFSEKAKGEGYCERKVSIYCSRCSQYSKRAALEFSSIIPSSAMKISRIFFKTAIY